MCSLELRSLSPSLGIDLALGSIEQMACVYLDKWMNCCPGTALLVAIVGHRLGGRIDRADDTRVLEQVDGIAV